MSITTGVTQDHLHRSEVWSANIKEVLEDSLSGMGYVNWLTDFPDGDAFNIPSIGEATVRDYQEDTAIVYDSLDTGEFNFSITEYKSAATYITKKARQDAYYAARLEAKFVPSQTRALEEVLESDIWDLAGTGGAQGGGQTVGGANTINGADHRIFADATSGANNSAVKAADFAQALFALKKANVPDASLVAIVDPNVEATINQLITITGSTVSQNQRWESIVETGVANGPKFVFNLYGFDVYTSNYLAKSTTAESTVSNPVTNVLFSAADREILPFVGAWRQMPEVESEYNKDKQREEYLVTSRYGLKVYRPENLVTIISDGTTNVFTA